MANAPHNPPFRAELIGSLIRPDAIKAVRKAFEAGETDAANMRDVESAEIKKVIALQEELGFKVVSDGELRRYSYYDSFTTHGITGMREGPDIRGKFAYHDKGGDVIGQRVPQIYDKVSWAGPTNVSDYEFAASCTKSAIVKMTVPGPAYIHFRAGRANISEDIYPNLDDYWSDLVGAYHGEIKSLYDGGCRYFQIDETSIAKLGDPEIRAGLAERGDDWEQLLDTYIEACNAVADGAPDDMAVGIHLCRGNKAGHWQAAGGYDDVAEKLFRNLRINTYFLEYDSERAGSFAPLAALPDDKTVVIGAMTTKSAELETADALKARIKEAAEFVDLDRLCISPQCGFSSSVEGVMNVEQQRAKLTRLIEVARELWSDA
ncbi:MAG: 5-methyltetrahydropteroyltriglutamate--homocysteine S-methyltransferase [Rhodospirillales bacterium]|jgi:5-methyltetrahydropteroyltriglutamate--homocysteine methyltransferase|nr:5-methyltetrahydropteroyltriglutamate--homocysteine S-methyltransferase [Rhodospirillales bacterium]MBT4006839.1 5-methyltetrahydropteroyltriglutamate--homocysteine S-methyltransferase [Rhodospirillales bacterium]MBT5075382.1 5-methyltetrahydropteroyltriglutamate--homocysteine S-methyltransferase [Rhodospirillales bacterium]MBT5113134.1 5-methyltetrahydropteroyltriglutamate--homocysteine S-methyltransferase [Rhodospirillales bacterium]MBT5673010.1 5-methyltetrahydropteroyltriglutamate--homoc